ncbi:hypothetical protein BCR43DRAFT_499143, partial [Syncephalastrum racemosum]
MVLSTERLPRVGQKPGIEGLKYAFMCTTTYRHVHAHIHLCITYALHVPVFAQCLSHNSQWFC